MYWSIKYCNFFSLVMAKERIIVSLTTYSKRIGNIPTVLETIFNQTQKPDLVVLNLAFNESIPDDVQNYIEFCYT